MERRKNARFAVPKLGYVNFEPYNTGGVITEISRTGFRFHTPTPVQQGGIVRLSILLGAANMLEAVGELVWTDAARKVGGVRFIVLPPAAADQIEVWAIANNKAGAEKPELVSPSVQAPNVPRTQVPPKDAASGFGPAAQSQPGVHTQHAAEPAWRSAAPAEQNSRPASAAPPPQIPPAGRASGAMPASVTPPSSAAAPPPRYDSVLPGKPGTMPWITHFDPDPEPRSGSVFIRGLVGGVIACLMIAALGWFGLHSDSWRIAAFPWITSRASNSVPPENVSPNSPPPSAPFPATAPSPAAPGANSALPNPAQSDPADNVLKSPEQAPDSALNAAKSPTAPSAPAADAPAAEPALGRQPEVRSGQDVQPPSQTAKEPPRQKPPQDSLVPASEHIRSASPPAASAAPAAPGEPQFLLARQYLYGEGRPRNPEVASQLLWSAVEKGNLPAETTLADLYLHGDGVTKSCDQARVLLSAASEKGDAAASLKLRELNQTGCR